MPLLAALLIAVVVAGCGGGSQQASPQPADPPQATGPDRQPPQSESAEESDPPPLLSKSAVGELERFADRAPGEVSIAIAPLGKADQTEVGAVSGDRAWSTMKVPVLVALIRQQRRAGGLSAEQRSQAAAALESSDNEAALALFAALERARGSTVAASAAIDDVLRDAGDKRTQVNTVPSPEGYSTFGQTKWPAAAANRFFGALAAGCLLNRDETDYVVGLMEGVVADQSWGLGQAFPASSDASVAFKGGWGPEPAGGYLVRQSGIVAERKSGYAASVIAIPDDTGGGSFEAGQALVSETMDLVAAETSPTDRAAVTCPR